MSVSYSYSELPPRSELRRHIECFWTMRPQATPGYAKPSRIIPDGCTDIIFDFGDARQGHRAFVVGTMTRPLLVQAVPGADLFGIRFCPGGSQPFLDFFAAECRDDVADLECFWGRAVPELWDRLAEKPTADARKTCLEAYLLKEFGWRLGLCPYVQYSVRAIQDHRGCVRMKNLERGTGLSARQLERKFLKDIGIPPKTFARVIRFRRLVESALADPPRDWTTLALSSGYSDQSHLIRDFKELSGVTPSVYFAER